MSNSKFYMILGPSGVGKGSIISKLKQKLPNTIFPVSYTTREMRPGEVNGQTYNFISRNTFEEKIKNNELLEYALVHKKAYYGTDKQTILDGLNANKNVIREIDFQGYESVKKILSPNQYKTIFITAGDWDSLEKRITSRSPISEEELKKRKQSYDTEIKYKDTADYIISNKNGELEQATQKIIDIITSS
jgi:guanylate kinase